MDLDFNPETGLYLTAAFLGVITVLYFGSAYIFQLSPITKSSILFASFMFFFTVSLWLPEDEKIYSLISQGIGSVSYLVFLVYTASRFSLNQDQIFLFLLTSSTLFLALGYLLNNGKLEPEHKTARNVAAGIIVVLVALVMFDAIGSQPTYELQLKDRVEIAGNADELTIGSITVSNSFLLPRQIEGRSYRACIPGEREHRIHISENLDESIGGNEERQYNLTARSLPDHRSNISGTFTVEEADSCPAGETGVDSRTLYVFRDEPVRGINN